MKENTETTDKWIQEIMATLLILGVIAAATMAIIGGSIFLYRHGFETANYHVFHGEPAQLRSIGGVLSQTLAFRGRGIIQLALLLLVLTPIARVVFSVFAFFQEKDMLYVVVNLIVLGFLMFSLVGGVAIK
jgi:uncharacterized membrane protein